MAADRRPGLLLDRHAPARRRPHRRAGGAHRAAGPAGHALRLDAVALLVPGYDEGIAFFAALGFRVAADADMGGGKRWVVVEPPGGGTGLVLARAVGDQADAVGRQAGGRVGWFLRADDFDAAHARIAAAGGTFEEEPRSEPYGRVAVWRDPWGNRWDLLGP